MPPDKKYRMSEEQRNRVLELHEAGYGRTQIQIETGVSQPTIRKILRDAGYDIRDAGKPTIITNELRDKVVELRNRGLSYRTIAEQVKLAKRTVMNIVADNASKVDGHGNSPSPEEFIRTWQENASLAEVAAKLGMPVTAVASRAYAYRLRGVPLKKYRFGGYNWDELREFAELFQEDEEEDEQS